MKIKSIKYNSQMAQARRDDIKSQTRRIINPQPIPANEVESHGLPLYSNDCLWKDPISVATSYISNKKNGPTGYEKYCPYGKIGDIIAVLEILEDGTLAYDGDDLILNVRIERLQTINHEDMEKEGLKTASTNKSHLTFQFMNLWESIFGKNSWNKNPWVWVIEFKRNT